MRAQRAARGLSEQQLLGLAPTPAPASSSGGGGNSSGLPRPADGGGDAGTAPAPQQAAAVVAAEHQRKLTQRLKARGLHGGGATDEADGGGGAGESTTTAAAAAATTAPTTTVTASPAGAALEELARAAEKAFDAGMGDWHLQPRHDASERYHARLALGPLQPEVLKARHGLREEDCLRLYALLRAHCLGFQSEARAVVGRAAPAGRAQLLLAVWRGFSRLWDDAARCAFGGEVAAAVSELEATHAALGDALARLEAALEENGELRARCRDAVGANLERMLGWRTLQAKADSLEGESCC